MESAQQLQMVVAEVQAARQQVASLNAQVRELEGTITAVKEQPEEMSLHRQMGTILVEVKDREQLLTDLETTLSQMKSAVETMGSREAELVATYEKLKQSLEDEFAKFGRLDLCSCFKWSGTGIDRKKW